nr:MAG TPA: hypothetical protein [Bacteriophage sp.]
MKNVVFNPFKEFLFLGVSPLNVRYALAVNSYKVAIFLVRD